MAKAQKTDAVWVEINVETLEENLRTPYDMYKAAYKVMKEARTFFEEEMNAAAKLAEGKRLVFGYNFGKLSVAVVDAEASKPKSKPAGSLSDYLAGMKSSGQRC